MVNVFIPKEKDPQESRVAATPETVKKLIQAGAEVTVEAGAGAHARLPDIGYSNAGAAIATDPASALAAAQLVLKVQPPTTEEIQALSSGAAVAGFFAPYDQPQRVAELADAGITTFSMELVPRISRAQSMDALSSQASIAGYKAVLLGALSLGRYFPLLMTAAGTIPPARVVVMGAGVAGLQAVATARRLGAVVEVSDIRPVVKEQVESLGGKFIELPLEESGEGQGGYAKQMTPEFLAKQREIVKRHLSQADVAITTALIPGKKAPILINEEMVRAMKPGSVIVDLAVSQGGNCALSKADEEVEVDGVLILGPSNLPSQTMAHDASVLYARNLLALVDLMLEEGALAPDLEDEVLAGCLLTHDGKITQTRVAEMLGQPQPGPEETEGAEKAGKAEEPGEAEEVAHQETREITPLSSADEANANSEQNSGESS
ncbi:MAG: Re/Si-specific NAD(P)(+) transhydrogenase subunit alpha [Acidobacteriota bacterium]